MFEEPRMRLEDAIAALAQIPETLQRRLAGLSDSQLRHKPAPDTFSMLEQVCHLRDIEVEGYARRLQLLLHEEHPALPDLNGGVLARERHYNSQDLQPAVQTFIAARHGCLKTLAGVTAAQLKRSGHLHKVGEVTLAKLLELWVGHDREHLREMDGLLPIVRTLAARELELRGSAPRG